MCRTSPIIIHLPQGCQRDGITKREALKTSYDYAISLSARCEFNGRVNSKLRRHKHSLFNIAEQTSNKDRSEPSVYEILRASQTSNESYYIGQSNTIYTREESALCYFLIVSLTLVCPVNLGCVVLRYYFGPNSEKPNFNTKSLHYFETNAHKLTRACVLIGLCGQSTVIQRPLKVALKEAIHFRWLTPYINIPTQRR